MFSKFDVLFAFSNILLWSLVFVTLFKKKKSGLHLQILLKCFSLLYKNIPDRTARAAADCTD